MCVVLLSIENKMDMPVKYEIKLKADETKLKSFTMLKPTYLICG